VIKIEGEPQIRVGLISGASDARLTLQGECRLAGGAIVKQGDYTATAEGGAVRLSGGASFQAREIELVPIDFDSSSIVVHDVTIGVDFHWQRKESQRFQGSIKLINREGGVVVINELPLESYLVSVISSEMSASCPEELLRAHAIVSRSWLLAQLTASPDKRPDSPVTSEGASREQIKWYDRESHSDFDVCADDHCQRYQGISKAFSKGAFDAIAATRGHALVWGDEICDARYSKSCGGMTEVFRAAWEEKQVAYLPSIYDGAQFPAGYGLPLRDESNATKWIMTSPAAYCNAAERELLSRILPGFDQETADFYRWEVVYSSDELREILRARLGIDFGNFITLDPVERGESGRLVRLRIRGDKDDLTIGKELEIRRALSRSHLYSSAFVVRSEPHPVMGFPQRYRLIGAGWGHGVGLCQIGAAVMADQGHAHREILNHYFRGASLSRLYS
jgi:SpoIID/LytB domain protein